MRIHPRAACGIFVYFLMGIILEKIFKKEIIDNIFFIILMPILGLIVNNYFQKRYKKTREFDEIDGLFENTDDI